MTLLKLLFITACCHLAAAAVFAGAMDWPNGQSVVGSMLFSPLLALAGWPMAFLTLLLVFIMWVIRQQGLFRQSWVFVLAGAVAGTGLGALCAGGPEPRWRLAFIIAGCLVGTLSNIMVAWFQSINAEQTASPNGGPAGQLGNSGAGGGPPSVS
jgi:hypothetical protein